MLGVCGMGMGPLAIYMRGEGWAVSGWDDAIVPPMSEFLRTAGVVFCDSFPEEAPPSLAGHSSAVKEGHALRKLAAEKGVRIVRRGELLAERLQGKQLVSVCGSHGKTTTCGMLIQSLLAAGTDAGYVLGGLFRNADMPPAHASRTSPWVVAEIDESDGTINRFAPEIAVAVNLDWDHPDYYRSVEDLEAVFAKLFARTRRAVFITHESERLRRVAGMAPVPVFSVSVGRGGSGARGDFHAEIIGVSHETTRVALGGRFPQGEIVLPVAGRFNVSNAVMAVAVAWFISGRIGAEPLGAFRGMRRRQDVLFEAEGVRVLADYAHHPTEIAALLGFLRERTAGADRQGETLVAVFQPHRHSRTRQYAREFAVALGAADAVLLLPVYAAGEATLEGGTSASVFAAATGDARFVLLENEDALQAALDGHLAAAAGKNLTIVFVGAGNVDRMGVAFVKTLQAARFGERMRKELPAGSVFTGNFPLGKNTTLGVGGPCSWLAEPESLAELQTLLRCAREMGVPVLVLGNGSNLLVPDDGFAGLAIRLASATWTGIREDATGGLIHAGGGARLHRIAQKAALAGMDGFAFLAGIPGTLGGALRMNAGAMGTSIFDRVAWVKWLLPDGVEQVRERDFFTNTTYRNCPELRDAVVLESALRANGTVAPGTALEEIRANARRRHTTQPREPSAGSVFKNPPGESAGRLIDGLGLKGLRIGGAAVSEVHANFIVNRGGATAADIIALVHHVHNAVHAAHGIRLEPEIILAGDNWDRVLNNGEIGNLFPEKRTHFRSQTD